MLLGVDVGGTFTDAVLVDDDGATFTAKTPTTSDGQQAGVIAAIEAVCAHAEARTRADTPTRTHTRPRTRGTPKIERFAHGMTIATNALLESSEARPPARTALIATDGFTDIVELGRQARASLYRLCEAGPKPLVPPELRYGANERMGPNGPLRALDPRATAELLERLAATAPEAVAVVLLHSYAHPQHERRLGELIEERLPDAHLSLSHELVGTFREYERASTTEIDAAVSPLLKRYLERLGAQAHAQGLPEVQVMQSSGGLTDTRRAARHAALTVLSGPAGGVGGALLLSEAAGEREVLCFDMGGTSCDVCVIDGGKVAETAQRSVAGRPLALPALDIHTVGAGGGSIAWRDGGGALRVGPASAGAVPGPACYGNGGQHATVTDANLVLGRLLADTPLAGAVALDRSAAERVITELAGELGLDSIACAEGIVRVAETEMLRALTVMTVARGIDPRRFALMPFGGAGPLHAAAMAGELGIERVLCPRACGVLSALGLAAAAPRRDASSTVMLSGRTLTTESLAEALERLIERAAAELDEPPVRIEVRYELRYKGQSFELTVDDVIDPGDFGGWLGVLTSNTPPAGERAACRATPPNGADAAGTTAPTGGERALLDPARLIERFEAAHVQRYGYRDERAEVQLVNVRVSAVGIRPALRLKAFEGEPPTHASTQVVFGGRWVDAECWRGELSAGTRVRGPALCALPESTLLVPPGWEGTVDEYGTVALERTA
jgi:N-methylhydantoinase A